MTRRRVALVGTAGSSVHAPFDDKSWEIWGVSSRARHVTRAERWFELHRLDGEPPDWAANWRRTMKVFTHDIAEVLMLYPEPDLAPKVVAYPYEKIVARFGTFFMTSSFSWMMALAIDEMAPTGTMAEPGCEIGVFGVDMEYGTEYRQQRAGLRHFMALARALGIQVTYLASGGLAYDPVPYPMWQDDPLLSKVTLRNKTARENIDQFNESLRLTRTMIAQNKAVRGAIDQMQLPGWDPAQRLRELDRELEGLMSTSASLSKDIVHWSAVDEEQNWIRDYLQP